ncbi:hypothetical protein KFU94_15560 [Chloroflexi bacterium TSY]|nr:hypothetical protein [Chloroflexi bacterium TSY]
MRKRFGTTTVELEVEVVAVVVWDHACGDGVRECIGNRSTMCCMSILRSGL